MMLRRRERTLEELYDATERLAEPKITPILKGSCRIQGPVDESGCELRSADSGQFPIEEICLDVKENLETRAESGTCNVCCAPCTSCLHSNRTKAVMKSKCEGTLSGNINAKTEDGSCSSIGVGEPFNKGRVHDDRQHASSETSNLLSSSSSHDSSIENAEKAASRASVTCHAPENVNMPQKFSSDEPVGGDKPLPESVINQKAFSSLVEEQHGPDYEGDSMSCISRVRDANVAHGLNVDFDKKDKICSSVSVDRLPANIVEKGVQNAVTRYCHDHENAESKTDLKGPSTCPEEPSLKKSPTSANAGFSHKSEVTDFSPAKGNHPPQEHSPCSCSQSGYSFHHDADSRERERNENPQLQAEIPECSMDNEKSSVAGQLAGGIDDNKKSLAVPNFEVGNTNKIRTDATLVSLEDADACTGTEIGKDNRVCSEKAIECYRVNEQNKLPSSLSETSGIQVSQMQSQTIEGEDSAEAEHDVKVCDICGDAGQEELLAICSRCSDGAEHTYCMRVKLDKVPEGDWLCEECQLKEETENWKVDNPDPITGTSEVSSLKGKSQKLVSTLDPKNLPSLENKMDNLDAETAGKELQRTQIFSKTKADNVESTLLASKKLSETNMGTMGTMSPRRRTLSHDNSFNNSDSGKVKPSNMASSSGGPPVNNSQSFVRCQVSSGSNPSKVAHCESTRGPLLKSFSFSNSKMPKVKQLDENVLHKQKAAKEFSRKEGLVSTITKSASFKSMSSGSFNNESVSKTQSLSAVHAEELRGGKQTKERNVIDKKNSSTSDRSFANPSPMTGTSNLSSKADPKVARQDGKLNNMPDSSNPGINRGSINNLGCDEAKKHSSYSSKTLGSTSNGLCKSEDHKPCQVVPKENVHASSAAGSRSCSNLPTVSQCSTPQTADSTQRGDKTRDTTLFSSSRQAPSSSNRVLRCQRCNETGHATQFCSVDKFRMSALKPSAERNLKEGSTKTNKWKDAVQVTNSKNRMQRNITSPDQSEEISTSSADLNSEVTSKDFLSSSLSCPGNFPPLEGTADGQEILRLSATDFSKAAAIVSIKQKTIYPEKALSVPTEGTGIPSVELKVKPLTQILPNQASVSACPLRASAIPEPEFIWQGCFEVLRSGRLPELCDGVQAHFSTCVSPIALEVATKFPHTVKLEGVSRQSSWPMQFQEYSPKEENIALFFFAKDIESYEKNYSKLLDNMLKNDLVLRGDIDTVELLIFPSNLLPESSQRWNKLLFLWGVFRLRRKSCLEDQAWFQERPCWSDLNKEAMVEDLPTPVVSEVSTSRDMSYDENSRKDLTGCNGSPKTTAVKSTTSLDFLDLPPSLGIGDRIRKTEETSQKSSHETSADGILPPEQITSAFSNNMDSDLRDGGDVEILQRSQENSVHNFHSIDRVLPKHSVSSNCGQGTKNISVVKIKQEESFVKSEPDLDNELLENSLEIDRLSWESRSNRKRAPSRSTEMLLHVSGEALKSSGETMQWKEEANFMSLDDQKEHKKMKFDGVPGSCSSKAEGFSGRLSSKIHPMSSTLINDFIYNESMHASSSSAELHFFPLDSGPIKNTKEENFVYVLSSDDEELPESNAPDLELVLGGRKKSSKSDMLPLFSSKVGERGNRDKQPAPAVDDGDDMSSSLSLALALTGSDKAQTVKPMSKTGQVLPEKPCANTSLFLFPGSTDT